MRQNLDQVEAGVGSKKVPFDRQGFEALDQKRRDVIARTEQLRAEKKALSREIGMARSRGVDAAELMARSQDLGDSIQGLEQELAQLEEAFQGILLQIPNLPDGSVPLGGDASDNHEVRVWGQPTAFDFSARPHWEVGEGLGLLDFPRAARMTGARFAVSYGSLARLERALAQFMLDLHVGTHGYREVLVPYLVNTASLVGTGNLPKFKEDLFHMEGTDWYLIPTAEVPLTNLHREEQLDPASLPLKYVAHTPCFRSEAGSYGRDVRGLIRQLQFLKVELMWFADPQTSLEDLELLTAHAQKVLELLELPYRTVLLCTGDMSFSSLKTYDIEVWMPSRNGYMEISSCSCFGAFQARRAQIRLPGKAYVHTLNGSGLAIGRTVAAILENNQTADGRVRIPSALQPYMGGREQL